MIEKAGKKKLGRPFKPPGEVRILMAHRVLPSTLEALNEIAEQSGKSRGEVLDRLIAKEYRRISTRATRKHE